MAATLRIDVYLDLVCPWCLIGKRYLDEAIAQFHQSAPASRVDLHWHSVQLLPEVPQQGLAFQAFYLKRLGSAEGLRQRQAQVNAAAARAGFQIDFNAIPVMPNTLQAHQLLRYASTRMAAEPFAVLLEALFAAHFHGGANLGERATLCRIAARHGLNAAALEDWITGGAGKPEARDVPGVPFFVFNQRVALSGAQPPDRLLDAMQQAQVAAQAAAQAEPAL